MYKFEIFGKLLPCLSIALFMLMLSNPVYPIELNYEFDDDKFKYFYTCELGEPKLTVIGNGISYVYRGWDARTRMVRKVAHIGLLAGGIVGFIGGITAITASIMVLAPVVIYATFKGLLLILDSVCANIFFPPRAVRPPHVNSSVITVFPFN